MVIRVNDPLLPGLSLPSLEPPNVISRLFRVDHLTWSGKLLMRRVSVSFYSFVFESGDRKLNFFYSFFI